MKRIILALMTLALLLTAGLIGAQDTTPDAEDSTLYAIMAEIDYNDAGQITIGNIVVIPAGDFVAYNYPAGTRVIIIGTLLDDDILQAISIVMFEELLIVDADMDEIDGDEGDALNLRHPVAAAIAAHFELNYETVYNLWHIEYRLGFGQITKALELANLVESISYEDAIQMLLAGENIVQVARANGVHPRELAPGRVIGRVDRFATTDDTETTDTTNAPAEAGLNKFGCPGRGNSCNAPGKSK